MIGILIRPWISKAIGKILDSKCSVWLVPVFVKANRIDLSLCEKKKFCSYNDFFTRKFTSDARHILMEKNIWISPCDGKLTVYPILDDSRFLIKHTWYTVEELLRDQKLSVKYRGGYAWIFRLSVEDYHRYCYVADGLQSLSLIHIYGYKKMINEAAKTYPNFKAVATTLREVKTATVNDWSAICWADGEIYKAKDYKGLEIMDRVGGGDSFASGLIYGLMSSENAELAVNYGAAHGALAMTTPVSYTHLDVYKRQDTQCAFASLKAFLASENDNAVPVHFVSDNEEVGRCV